MGCFFDFQLMRSSTRKKLKPVVDLLVLGQAPKSELVEPVRLSFEACLKKRPIDESYFWY